MSLNYSASISSIQNGIAQYQAQLKPLLDQQNAITSKYANIVDINYAVSHGQIPATDANAYQTLLSQISDLNDRIRILKDESNTLQNAPQNPSNVQSQFLVFNNQSPSLVTPNSSSKSSSSIPTWALLLGLGVLGFVLFKR